jgi:hypothetical protein
MGAWEASKDFDKVLTAIGRNRRFLLEIFGALQKSSTPITYEVARGIVEQMLRNSGITVQEECWPVLLKFAERDGLIDYRFLLEVYKERIRRIDTHPILKAGASSEQ